MAVTTAGSAELQEVWRRPVSTRERILRTFFRSWPGVAGLVVLLAVVGAAIFAPVVAPISPVQQNIANRLRPPFWEARALPNHPLGTDAFGRDIWSRLVHGSRASLSVAVLAGVIALTLGVLLGLVSGYFGARIDTVIMRVGDAQIAFPFLVIAIAIIAVLGPSLVNLIVLIGYWGWVRYAKVTRGQVLSARQKEYVEAAHVIGTPAHQIIVRHLLPNVISPVIVLLTLSMAGLIVVESSLSFLGLGIQPPTPSWGSMLSEGRSVIDRAWWVSTFPGLAITITVLAINLLGDAIRDALDPRMRV